MAESTAKEWTLKELAEETGVPERTIRFWISRELVDPPLRAGRSAAYGEKHRDRILAIRKLQEKGLMLAEIEHALTAVGLEQPMYVSALVSGKAPESRDMLWFEQDGSLETASAAPAYAPALPEPEIWRSFVISPDVVVMLRAGVAPWRTKRVTSALRRFAAEVMPSNLKEDQGE